MLFMLKISLNCIILLFHTELHSDRVTRIWSLFYYLNTGFFSFNLSTDSAFFFCSDNCIQSYTLRTGSIHRSCRKTTHGKLFGFIPKDHWHILKASFLLSMLLLWCWLNIRTWSRYYKLANPSRSILTDMERQCYQHNVRMNRHRHVSSCQSWRWCSWC